MSIESIINDRSVTNNTKKLYKLRKRKQSSYKDVLIKLHDDLTINHSNYILELSDTSLTVNTEGDKSIDLTSYINDFIHKYFEENTPGNVGKEQDFFTVRCVNDTFYEVILK